MPYTQQQINSISHRLRHWGRDRMGRFERYAIMSAIDSLRAYERESQWEIEIALNASRTIECHECGGIIGYIDNDFEYVWRDEDEVVEIGDMAFCSRDCAYDAGYDCCRYCGEWGCSDDMVYVEDEGCYCDGDCAERDGNRRCACCGDWHSERNGSDVMNDGEEEFWCDSCIGRYASYCEECGNRFHEDDIHYCEVTDSYICDGCREHHDGEERYLHSYGYTPPLVFRGDASYSPYLGTELETDGGSRRGDYVTDLDGLCVDGKEFREHFYMTRDSSLENGVEITGHPMTLSYHVALAPLYMAIGETARKYGFRSHDGGRCGLHIHVNRDFFGRTKAIQDLGGYKLMRLLQRFEQAFTQFSRRTDNYWCKYQTDGDYTPKKDEVRISRHIVEPKVIDKASMMMSERRHEQALNFQHRDTFEFRIFRGTLKWETYYACLALVNGMCHAVKHHGSVWVESVSWYDLMDEIIERVDEPTAREHLESYLESKGLL